MNPHTPASAAYRVPTIRHSFRCTATLHPCCHGNERILRLRFIDPLPVQPFVKGSAVIEHTVQDHLHPALVHLFHKPDEKLVARLQIPDISGTLLVFLRPDIVIGAFRERISAVLYDPAVVRIDVIIVLYIILMVAG